MTPAWDLFDIFLKLFCEQIVFFRDILRARKYGLKRQRKCFWHIIFPSFVKKPCCNFKEWAGQVDWGVDPVQQEFCWSIAIDHFALREMIDHPREDSNAQKQAARQIKFSIFSKGNCKQAGPMLSKPFFWGAAISFKQWRLWMISYRLVCQVEHLAVEEGSFALLDRDHRLSVSKIWTRHKFVWE